MSMARHLRRLGHTVTIVATDAFGRLPDDDDLGVVRVGDLRSSPVMRRLLRRGDLSIPGRGTSTLEVPPTALLTKVLVPDAHVLSWLPAALVVVRRIIAKGSVDCLVTSSPPESAHLVGLLLGGRRPPWIADFRDGWSFEPLRETFPTGAQRRLDRWLERRVTQAADVATGAYAAVAHDLETRLGARAHYISNAWDPEAAPEQSEIAQRRAFASERPHDLVTLVYTGTLSGVRGLDPSPLFKALHKVRDEPGLVPMRLVVAGRLTTDERALLNRSRLGQAVEHLGMLDRASALKLQRSADALVLLTARNASATTAKLFEYLAAGKPIIALAEGNEVERIVRETNTGVTVPPDDVAAITAALRRVASGELSAAYAPRNLEQFSYPRPAEAMAELIETAIERRAAYR